jgi:hypothetical protein
MRLFLFFIFCFFSVEVLAQTATPIVQGSKLYEFKNGIRADSAAFMPRRDTFTSDATMKAPGMLLYNLSDSLMYYRNNFRWKPLSSGSTPTIYTSDGSILDERTITGTPSTGISWNNFSAFSINASDGFGTTGDYGLYPQGFSWSWNLPGEPTSNITYNSNTYNMLLQTSANYNVNFSENAQTGRTYNLYQRVLGAVTNPEQVELQQGFSFDSSIFFIRHYKTNWSVTPNKLFDLDSFGTVKLDKYRNNSTEDSVLSTDQFGKVKLKYVSSALWDSTKIKDSVILNRSSSVQTSANYSISGNGSASLFNSANASAATFTRYLHLSHDGVDTSKKAWAIGLMGTPSTSGPTTPTGDSLKFRACNNSGAYYADIMTLTRQGTINIPGLLVLGNVNSSAQQLLVNGSTNIIKDVAVRGIVNYTFLRERGNSTVTGDYTVTNTDLYINVNNSANCTITLSLPGAYATYHIKKISNNASTVTIVGPNGTELIDGSTSLVISAYNTAVTLHEDGTSYSVY